MVSGQLLRGAALLCASVGVFTMAGCSSPDDDDVTEVGTLTGVITGTIMDSSGAPIEGATVRYTGNTDTSAKAEVTALTNASGQFEMPGIVVTNVTSIGSNDANGPITLVIDGPETGTPTMGATVEVTPSAQSSSSASSTVFIDGFNVDTGPVRIPRLATTVKGTLRDSATGAAVVGVGLNLDFQGVEFEQDGMTGIASTYDAGSNLTATSDAAGQFIFTAVYDDSCVRLNVSGVAIEAVSGAAPPCTDLSAGDGDSGDTDTGDDTTALYFATNVDGGTLQLANVYVGAFDEGDSIAPQVSGVAGVVDITLSPAPLASSVTGVAPNGLTVNFSEPMQALIDAADVSVVVGTAPDQYIADLAAVRQPSSTQLVVEVATALPSGTPVQLLVAREALLDTAGNALALSADLAYDAFGGSNSAYLTLSLVSFAALDVSPPFVTGVDGVADAQNNPGQLDESVTGTGATPLTVRFSEPLQNLIAAGDVSVLLGSGSEQSTAEVVGVELVGGTALQIQLGEDLPLGTSVTVQLTKDELLDFAGNPVALNGALAYDTVGGNNGELLVLQLLTADGPDTIAPTVAGVEGVVDPRANPGALDSSTTGVEPNGLVVAFSEAMLTPVGQSDVAVFIDPDGENLTAVIADLQFDGLELTINLTEPLPETTELQVRLLREAFRDEAGNVVTTGASVNYDRLSGGSNEYLTLSLISYPPAP